MATICVYASSSEAVAPELRELARALGSAIAAAGHALVYGGGGVGLMGDVARAALAGGAHVTGVIPTWLHRAEVAMHEVDELIEVPDLRTRKDVMETNADAFLVLPGGLGTLDEMIEALTQRQLGRHEKAIVLLDPTGHWAALHVLLEQMLTAGMLEPATAGLLQRTTTIEAALEAVSAPAT